LVFGVNVREPLSQALVIPHVRQGFAPMDPAGTLALGPATLILHRTALART
jgi:hypothetical protein